MRPQQTAALGRAAQHPVRRIRRARNCCRTQATPERLAAEALAWLDDPQRVAGTERALHALHLSLRREHRAGRDRCDREDPGSLTSSRSTGRRARASSPASTRPGRGPLAGPVVAAAVILDELQPIEGLADSKQLTPLRASACSTRSAPRPVLLHRPGQRRGDRQRSTSCRPRCWRCSVRSRACGCGRARCWSTATGCRCSTMPAEAIVKGDAEVQAISAASILAKVHRDRLCQALHAQHPQYGFDAPQGLPDAGAPGGAACAWRLPAASAHRSRRCASLLETERWPAPRTISLARQPAAGSVCAGWRPIPRRYRKARRKSGSRANTSAAPSLRAAAWRCTPWSAKPGWARPALRAAGGPCRARSSSSRPR